jgi:hypothetical protein
VKILVPVVNGVNGLKGDKEEDLVLLSINMNAERRLV